jgi:hypothetical protein
MDDRVMDETKIGWPLTLKRPIRTLHVKMQTADESAFSEQEIRIANYIESVIRKEHVCSACCGVGIVRENG